MPRPAGRDSRIDLAFMRRHALLVTSERLGLVIIGWTMPNV